MWQTFFLLAKPTETVCKELLGRLVYVHGIFKITYVMLDFSNSLLLVKVK